MLHKQESEVEIRPPREAQAKVGSKSDRQCKALPYESWQHPNTALIKETVKYQAKVSLLWTSRTLNMFQAWCTLLVMLDVYMYRCVYRGQLFLKPS